MKVILMILICLFVQIQTNFAQSATDLVVRAKTSIDKTDFAAAVADTTAAIKLDANNADAFFWRAYAYYKQKDYTHALPDLDESIRLNPQAHLPFGIRGVIRYRQNDFDNAIADYTKAVEINPKYQSGYYNRGIAIIHKTAPDWKAGLADFTKASELDSQDSSAFFYLGLVNSKLENWKEAEKGYVQASNLGDKTAELLANLSYVDIKMGFYTQAAMNAFQALEIDRKNQPARTNLKNAWDLRKKPFDAQLARELFDAVAANDNVKAINLMNSGADVNATVDYNNLKLSTALQRAAGNGNYFLVRALVILNANVDAQDVNGNAPLHFAAGYTQNYNDSVAITQFLIKNGANVNLTNTQGETPLFYSCLWSNDELVKTLLESGANPNFKDKVEDTPLMTAIRSGSDQSVRVLLAAGADVNAVDKPNGFNSLAWAIRRGGFGFTKIYLLLKAGMSADLSPDKVPTEYQEIYAFAQKLKSLPADSVEMKLFEQAANGSSSEFAKLLAANPAIEKTILNYLLLMSVASDNPAMLQALLAKGADPNYKIGDTPVLSFARFGKKNAAFAYLSNYATDDVRTAAAANDNKFADLVNNASKLMRLASGEIITANRRRDDGADKRTQCLSINEAANDVNSAIKYLDQAIAIAPLQNLAEIKTLKQNAVDSLRDVMGRGCPIFLH